MTDLANEQFVCVVAEDDTTQAHPLEVPAEADGTLLLSTVTSHFPGATGLKYKPAKARAFRAVKVQDEILFPPADGWGDQVYTVCIAASRTNLKRRHDAERSSVDGAADAAKSPRTERSEQTSDLIVLGLPYTTTEEEVKNYFEDFGALKFCELKYKPDGRSKGFAFIHFQSFEAQKRVIMQRHMIGNRWCDVKFPDSQQGRQNQMGVRDPSRDCKIFVARIANRITEQDLREHFDQFGEITDLFYPQPPRGFAFITFKESRVAHSLVGKDHILKDCSLHIGEPQPKESKFMYNEGQGRAQGGNYRGRFDRNPFSDDSQGDYRSGGKKPSPWQY